MSDDDKLDRDAIQKRRALLIASALLGMSACSSREPPPEPCLSRPYEPPTDQGGGGVAGPLPPVEGTPTATADPKISPEPCLSVAPPPEPTPSSPKKP